MAGRIERFGFVLSDHLIKTYAALCAAFALTIVTGNLVYQKFVYFSFPFYVFELSVGAILYPFTFMISDLTTEFFGKAKARYCVTLGLAINLVVALVLLGLDRLPATSWSTVSDSTFHQVFGHTPYASVISVFAAYVSQRCDISIYWFVRHKTSWLPLANFCAMSLSLLVDTCIVVSILNLLHLIPLGKALTIVANAYLFKLLLSVLNVPIFAFTTRWIRKHVFTH
ncbi:MAG: queuosine precursor transporter [Myxococcaceae bacterium]|nr:queuosine precursor transporter [Myxococcaceae bacterium]MBH2005886.1 queuosine precursor transporter [Myxococcaceae bacterium]